MIVLGTDWFALDELAGPFERVHDENEHLLSGRVIRGLDDGRHAPRLPVDNEEQHLGRLLGKVLLLDELRAPLRHLLFKIHK